MNTVMTVIDYPRFHKTTATLRNTVGDIVASGVWREDMSLLLTGITGQEKDMEKVSRFTGRRFLVNKMKVLQKSLAHILS